MELSFISLLESIITEGRAKSVIDRWSKYEIPDRGPVKNEDDWDYVVRIASASENDPSGNNKYLDYILGQMVHTFEENFYIPNSEGELPSIASGLDYLLELINDFHRLAERNLIKDKDIYRPEYKDLSTLMAVVSDAKQKAQEITKERELKGGADKIYQDSRWLVIVPKTYLASCYYGAGTKWCTTAKDNPTYFNNYTKEGILFYLLDKTRKEGTLYKLAIYRKYGSNRPASMVDTRTGINYYYAALEATNNIYGFDEEDQKVELKYVLPLLPKELVDAVENYYYTNLNRLNNLRKNEALQEQLLIRQQTELNNTRITELKEAFITLVKQDNWIFNYLEGEIDGTSVTHGSKLTSVFGSWEWMPLNEGKKFQIYAVSYGPTNPSDVIEGQRGYFIEGTFLPDDENLFTMRLYKQDPATGFGSVIDAEPIGEPISAPSLRIFNLNPFSLRYWNKLTALGYNNTSFHTIENWDPMGISRGITEDEEVDEAFIKTLIEGIEFYAFDLLFKGNVPVKDNKILWRARNRANTYRFEYPMSPRSLTMRFLNYIRENPGSTANDFYENALGERRAEGHNSMFFSSLKDAGLVAMRRIEGDARKFGYYIGPNYQAWTEGRLKRI